MDDVRDQYPNCPDRFYANIFYIEYGSSLSISAEDEKLGLLEIGIMSFGAKSDKLFKNLKHDSIFNPSFYGEVNVFDASASISFNGGICLNLEAKFYRLKEEFNSGILLH